MAKQTKEKKLKNDLAIRTIIFVFVVLALCCTFFFQEKVENFVNFALNKDAPETVIDENGLVFHFVDVGQADATIIEFPTGEVMVVDCGHYTSTSSQKFQSYLETIDLRYENGEKVIDYLILTHPDSDHIGGATYVFENYLVKNCYLPQIYYSEDGTSPNPGDVISTDERYGEIWALLENEVENFGCIKTYTTEFLTIKSQSFSQAQMNENSSMWLVEFFAPVTGAHYTDGNTNLALTNEYSPIMIISYMGKKVMLTGDAGETVETDFLKRVVDGTYGYPISYFDIDVLKVGHHGSRYSSTEEFLSVVMPEIAIISVGKNSYGHPASEVIDRLAQTGMNEMNIYRTDRNGNIAIGISQSGVLSLEADHVQYTLVEFKLWQIILIAAGASAIIIYLPYVVKVVKIHKKAKKLKI